MTGFAPRAEHATLGGGGRRVVRCAGGEERVRCPAPVASRIRARAGSRPMFDAFAWHREQCWADPVGASGVYFESTLPRGLGVLLSAALASAQAESPR